MPPTKKKAGVEVPPKKEKAGEVFKKTSRKMGVRRITTGS
jgi:hypothetical protein